MERFQKALLKEDESSKTDKCTLVQYCNEMKVDSRISSVFTFAAAVISDTQTIFYTGRLCSMFVPNCTAATPSVSITIANRPKAKVDFRTAAILQAIAVCS